jgi:hypothetical protein
MADAGEESPPSPQAPKVRKPSRRSSLAVARRLSRVSAAVGISLEEQLGLLPAKDEAATDVRLNQVGFNQQSGSCCISRGEIHSRQVARNLEVFVQCSSLSRLPTYLSSSFVFLELEFSTSASGDRERRLCLHFCFVFFLN